MERRWTVRPEEGWPRLTLMVGVALVALTFLVPLLFLPGEESTRESPTPLPTATLPVLPDTAAKPVAGWDEGQTVRFLSLGGEVTELTLKEYLWGVVAAEMPAVFDLEALKAQTVAARTYAYRQRELGVEKHPQADVCGDYTCCQAYLTREQATENWGEDAPTYREKITRAVADTNGLLCLYEGEPIDALFFSSAAGVTSDAVEVWGAEVPYLRSVESPEGAEVPGWQTLVTFTHQEFMDRFRESWPEAEFEGEPESWFSQPTLDHSGAVATITMGGVEVTGLQARQALGLRSAHFTVEPTGENILLHVTGYGHGVGMSQYGANALAQEGKNFEEILKWYYTGITVEGLT
ncbi:MAG: stage II sporulation protein D [Oscillospiraceae bacterium]|nr:stage II sporulation protein D [Oscillospiraceae bacterium]